MKTKEQIKFEKWARPILEKAQHALLLSHFGKIKIEFYKEESEYSSYAESVNHDPYVSLTIRCSHAMVKDFENKNEHESIIGTLIHEMVHPLTDPLFNAGMDRFLTKDNLKKEREKLTDHIANIMIKHNLV